MVEDSVEQQESREAAAVTVFVSDPTAEAERVSEALRAASFVVIDVPLSMLVARVAVQRPDVIIIDGDAEGALEAIARMREVSGCESIDVIFTGKSGGLPHVHEAIGGEQQEPMTAAEEAFAFEGSGFFPRPVDPVAVVKKVRALARGVNASSSPPPAAERKQSPAPPRTSSVPPQSVRPEMSIKRLSQPPPPPIEQASAPRPPLSDEIESMLSQAERRVAALPVQEAPLLSPEEEIDAVLSAEILSSLDAPLDDDDDDEESVVEGSSPRATTSGGRGATSGGRSETTGARREALTNDGSQLAPKTSGDVASPTTGLDKTGGASRSAFTSEGQRPQSTAGDSRPAQSAPATGPESPSHMPPFQSRPISSIPPPAYPAPPSVLSSTLGSELLMQRGGMLVAAKDAPPAFQPTEGAQWPPPAEPPRSVAQPPSASPASPSMIIGPGDAPRLIGHVIASRATGVVTLESEIGMRRIVLREGDVVTAASAVDGESLLAFLGARGDLPKERVAQLVGRLPPNGRHAGAALVAQGVLGQDQLWPVLRSHAEWIIAHSLLVERGTAHVEQEAPGRLRNEPSVFGGSTGAEVFVDVVRRAIDAPTAARALGGSSSRVADGQNIGLLAECALAENERDFVVASRGQSIAQVASAHPSVDVAPLFYALALLGVVEIVRAAAPREASVPPSPEGAALDDEAIRERVRARLELVDEGDYFALLGVPSNATSYEVRRAYLDLRRAFDEHRMLTPSLADLADDVRKIASVLDEAYEILGDSARRERYRRAIEDVPRAGE